MDIVLAKYTKAPTETENTAVYVVLNTNPSRALSVPLDPANRHYAEIMRQVDAGELTIQEADS